MWNEMRLPQMLWHHAICLSNVQKWYDKCAFVSPPNHICNTTWLYTLVIVNMCVFYSYTSAIAIGRCLFVRLLWNCKSCVWFLNLVCVVSKLPLRITLSCDYYNKNWHAPCNIWYININTCFHSIARNFHYWCEHVCQ